MPTRAFGTGRRGRRAFTAAPPARGLGVGRLGCRRRGRYRSAAEASRSPLGRRRRCRAVQRVSGGAATPRRRARGSRGAPCGLGVAAGLGVTFLSLSLLRDGGGWVKRKEGERKGEGLAARWQIDVVAGGRHSPNPSPLERRRARWSRGVLSSAPLFLSGQRRKEEGKDKGSRGAVALRRRRPGRGAAPGSPSVDTDGRERERSRETGKSDAMQMGARVRDRGTLPFFAQPKTPLGRPI